MEISMKLEKILENFIPFVVIGIGIVVFFSLLLMFSYLLIWGFIIGGILWICSLLFQYLSPNQSNQKKNGRIIEHESRK